MAFLSVFPQLLMGISAESQSLLATLFLSCTHTAAEEALCQALRASFYHQQKVHFYLSPRCCCCFFRLSSTFFRSDLRWRLSKMVLGASQG